MRSLEIGLVPRAEDLQGLGAELERHVLAHGHVVATPGCKQVDVVLLASDLDRDAVDAALALAHDVWGSRPIVIVTPEAPTRASRAALDAGVDGVVLAAALDSTLGPALAAVVSGQLCIPRATDEQPAAPLLSMREKQVLGMVVLGFSNGEIARRLFIADSTVKSHLNSAFRKLGVRSRQQAAALILDPTQGLGPGILTITT